MIREYVPVRLIVADDKIREVMKKSHSHFSVQLTPNINTNDESRRWLVGVESKDGTLNGSINKGQKFHKEVSAIIRRKGVMNSVGHFYAIYNEKDGLRINIKRIQPPTWFQSDKRFLDEWDSS